QPQQGAAFSVPASDVVNVALGTPKDPQQIAADQWEYTQFVISQQNDLSQIISTIQTYLKSYPDSPRSKEAQVLLAQYKQYQANGYVKFAGNWVTAADADKLQNQIQALMDAGIQSIHANAPAQAVDQAQQAMAIDPQSTDAMILSGVAEYSLGKQQMALTWFNKVLKEDSQNVIALNDTAVTSFALSEDLQPRALVCYQKALDLASGNRMLLDNIAAALNDYQGDTTRYLYKDLLKSFNAADQQMQVIMSQQGLYRFGGTWVSAAQKDQLQSQALAYEQQKTSLQANYDIAVVVLQGISAQLNIVDQQISVLNQSIAPLQAQINNGQTYSIGPYGWWYDNTFYSVTLLNQYLSELTQAQQMQVQLLTQQIQYQAQIKNIQGAAEKMIQAGQAMGYNGVQVMLLPGDLTNVPPPLPLSAPAQALGPPAANAPAN
ncbi:MAG TPA: hypothetical protein VKJ65_01870, partial [Phycisphaerae bacterium]|nr:hypothetical protein [Phycisphaerae bacterium]